MFREVTHTRVENVDSQGGVTPRRVTDSSAQEGALIQDEITPPVVNRVIKSDQAPHTPVLSVPTFTLRRERTADSLVSGC